MADDDSIAVRRTRRKSVGAHDTTTSSSPQPIAKTPRRTKKAVRFSDPGPSSTPTTSTTTPAASGLTPFLRRTSITTPKRRGRRHSSTPFRSSGHGLAGATPSKPSPSSFVQPLQQTVEGRVQRRLRRNGVRDMLNKMDREKHRSAQLSHEQIRDLEKELRARDREIYELRNATIEIDTDRIWHLEQQVEDLQSELDKQSAPDAADQTRGYDWTLAARDPFDDDFMDLMPDEEHFGDATAAQMACSTPSRTRSSFPTPPATSPTAPLTPCSVRTVLTPTSHAAVQVCFEDTEKQQLEDELASFQLEVAKLTTTLDSYKGLARRIAERVSSALPASTEDAAQASSTDALEKQVEALVQTMGDQTAALAQLTASIGDLGFPGNDVGDMVTALASGFRAARLELEYLTPGEITLPLTSHGAEALDLLLTRLRELARRVKEDETSIDEYHVLELSLRQQLDARVSVMDGLKTEMGKAETLMDAKNTRIRELDVANERLKGAVNGYIRDISELEHLVERMDHDHQAATSTHDAQHTSDQALLVSQSDSMAALEAKLGAAQALTARLQAQISDLQDAQTRHVASLNQQHGRSLALRDARVLELRGEVDEVGARLRAAHETVRRLRVENGQAVGTMEAERARAREVVEGMREELRRALEVGRGFADSPRRPTARRGSDASARSSAERGEDGGKEGVGEPLRRGSGVAGGLLSGELARRGGKKVRRKYDSGLGFLDEDEVDI